ncbi:hypothetical protein [Kitasatospora sp. NPDC056531]|uniref:hypothetical protein n=1 Tax=Kitasatospora sp. NPDC056531 TaxID=3345856 RepID=UPI0036D15062
MGKRHPLDRLAELSHNVRQHFVRQDWERHYEQAERLDRLTKSIDNVRQDLACQGVEQAKRLKEVAAYSKQIEAARDVHAMDEKRFVKSRRRSLTTFALSVAALITSALGLAVVGLPTQNDVQELKRCAPVVAQAGEVGSRAVAEQVIAGQFDPANAKNLNRVLTEAEANIEAVLGQASHCLDPAAHTRLASTLGLVKSAQKVLSAIPGLLPGGSSGNASPTPSPSPS